MRMRFVLFFSCLVVASSSASGLSVSESRAITFSVEKTGSAGGGENLWHPPDYSKQGDALGYAVGAFAVPPLLEDRVAFWIDIYSKYSSLEGVIHDSENVNIVYQDISFGDIWMRTDLTEAKKRKERRRRVKEAKGRIRQRLARLSKLSSPVGLSGEDLRYWYMFANLPAKTKFAHAMRKSRLRFQLGQSDIFKKGIFYSGKYLEEMESIFRAAKLPVELTRLPFVESSFNYRARSKVGASGIWQFMRSTGKRYMRVLRSVDERNDPLSATSAAARLLRQNYKVLNDWPLAVTAYNHGASGVRRQLQRHKVSSLSELVRVRHGRFGFASANFYASFLAALEVEKNATKYFGSVERMAADSSVKIKLTKPINVKRLIGWFNGDKKLAVEYNPHIKRSFWRGWDVLQKRDFIRVLPSREESVIASLAEMSAKTGDKPSSGIYKIRRGETLGGIARRLGVRLRTLMATNGIKYARKIQIGQRLVIPAQK